jgi:hypothetical protein
VLRPLLLTQSANLAPDPASPGERHKTNMPDDLARPLSMQQSDVAVLD